MAKLYFYYSSMNAGKSTALLQSNHNYRERGMNTLVFAPAVDTRFGEGIVKSRIGIESSAFSITRDQNLVALALKLGLDLVGRGGLSHHGDLARDAAVGPPPAAGDDGLGGRYGNGRSGRGEVGRRRLGHVGHSSGLGFSSGNTA